MSSPRTFSLAAIAGTLSLFALPAMPGFGQTTATTNPVGYLQVQCLGSSDTLVALPFTRPLAFTGAVAGVSGTANNVISFTTAPGFTASQFVYNPSGTPAITDNFYLIIGPNPVAVPGTVTVTSGSTTVTGTSGSFTKVTTGDRISINDGSNVLTYTVTAVASDTSLTIDRAYSDTTATGTTSTHAVATGTAKTATTVKTPTATKTAAGTKVTPVTADTPTVLSGLAATYDHSPYEGRWYTVTANDASTVTVNLNGDTLSSVAASTQVSIIPFWTLNTLFPAANVNVSFTPSTSALKLTTQILLPNYTSSGTNLSSASQYYYLSGSNTSNVGWRLYGDSSTVDHGNDYFIPDGNFTVRNDNGAPTLPLTFNGAVCVNKVATPIATSTSQAQDNAVGLTRPVAATLNSLGLSPADHSFRASTSPLSLVDQLLVFDNTTAAFNKSSVAQYYYVSSGSNVGWRLYGDASTVDHGTDSIPAASALIIRKGAVTSGTVTPVWTNAPNY